MPPVDPARLALAPEHLAELRELLARHVPQAEVRAYGSRVDGSSHEGSDLDLVLLDPRDRSQRVRGLSDLREALQASTLPMLVEVHDASQLPAAFQAEIERRYVVVQPGGDRPGRAFGAAGASSFNTAPRSD